MMTMMMNPWKPSLMMAQSVMRIKKARHSELNNVKKESVKQ